MNEELAQQGVTNLAGLVILTAIPVVAFALWCDYFERFFQAKLDEREEVNRSDELYRIRTSGFFIQLFEILIFFGTTPVRREHPGVAYPLFLGAILFQLWTQRGLERKIAGKELENGQSLYWQAVRTFFWSLLAGMTYVASILTSVFAFSVVGILMNAPIAVKTTLLLLGMAVGVVGGLCLSFAMGALFARKIMNAKPAPEGELRDALTQLFLKSKCDVPEFWVIDSQETHLGNVMMAGFPKGRGFFKPGFFVSSRIFGALTEGEFRSVVLHEISHWRLKHLKRRFIFSAGLILCASLITGLSVLSSRLAGVSEQGQTLVGFTSLLTSFLFAFRLLARLVKFQEIAADIHSIEKLGSALSDLSSALRKLDKAETGQSLRPDPSLLRPPRTLDPESMLVSLGHPGTEHRIRVLERYFERQAQLKKEAAKAEQSDSQAA